MANLAIEYGLGPIWHERTGDPAFRESRVASEALYIVQERALVELDSALERAGIDYATIKGGANRLVLYPNPALRACHDLDLLVRPADRAAATKVLLDLGYAARPKFDNISLELLMTRDQVDVDLHWGLLREGRLRNEDIDGMLSRRTRVSGTWTLDTNDAAFLMLVHPAFTKYLAAWDVGLHRVADIVLFLASQTVDRRKLVSTLRDNGVRTAAWATLRWVQMLMPDDRPRALNELCADLSPGVVRRTWIEAWLAKEWTTRMARVHWLRLALFSLPLHDRWSDVLGALRGRRRARGRQEKDMAEFRELFGE